MAQLLSNLTNTIPFSKSSYNNTINGCCFHDARCSGLGFARPRSRDCSDGVLAMAAEKRDNLGHLQQRPGIKRREAPTAPIGLWDRFPSARTVQQMMETMDRMVDDPFAFNSGWSSSPVPNDAGGYVRRRTPWEIKEGENEYKMRFDMPGMTKHDVKVWVEEQMLVIKAEKLPKKNNGQKNGVVAEDKDEGDWSAKSYGRYSSRIALPENVDFEKIKAEVKDGVLYITIPKASSTSKVFDISVQ